MNKKTEEMLSELISKQNEITERNPVETTKCVIDIARTYSIGSNSKELSISFLILEDGKFTLSPIPSSVMHSPLGEMMMKTLFKKISEDTVIHSIVDINFARGMVKKVESDNKEEGEKMFNSLKQEIAEARSKGEEPKCYSEFQDYMVALVYNKENVNIKMYDVIESSDKSAIVISNNPVTEEVMEYDQKQFVNFFK